MPSQSIRPSQFITTYGPGSIIEGENGPRLIPLPDIGLFNDPNIGLERLEISDSRLSNGILNGARVFRLPSNAELGKPENIPLYRTRAFPNWNLCVNSVNHRNSSSEDEYVIYQSKLRKCPVCEEETSKNREAIRFIVACPDGHMDDLDWNFFVHGGKRECDNHSFFTWIGGGSSLSSIYLRCEKCGSKSETLEQAYSHLWQCHGIFPERVGLRDQFVWKSCNSKARIIQRQASNLRVANVVSLFTIPPRDTALHRMLDERVLKSSIQMHTKQHGAFSSKEEFGKHLESLQSLNYMRRDTVEAILDCDWAEISQAISDLDKKPATSYRELINEEFVELLNASKNGAPPVHRPKPSTEILFEVDRTRVVSFQDVRGSELVVTPVNRLSEVVVQKSYRREIRRERSGIESDEDVPPSTVSVAFTMKNELWYPGMEMHGEGLFISTREGYLPELKGENAKEWLKAFNSSGSQTEYLFRDPQHKDELHPNFVYLHTLTHAIIRTLSMDSGYSSTALRERIYLDFENGNVKGGFLIYATQPGSDGTSGGLISLADTFQHIYDSALESVGRCSNDPLCVEDAFSSDGGKVNGACCYGCVLISETSCEHRNLWLDRNLILEDIL